MKEPIHVAAIDLGATSGRVILGRYADQALSMKEVHRFPNAFHHLGDHSYWDVPGLFSEIQKGLSAARAQVDRLDSCGVDTWAVDTVLLNQEDRLVFPVHSYRDSRTEPFYQELEEGAVEKVYAWTGIQNLSFNTSLQLQEILTNCPGVRKTVSRVLHLSDYFNFLLSGVRRNEMSILSTGQLVDVHSCKLSRPTLRHFGIPEDWFSEPALSPRRLGNVRGLPGLEETEMVLVPGHDTACAYDAMPSFGGSRDCFLSSGTWSLIGFESDEPLLGEDALRNRISNERLGNGRYRPIKNCLGLWLLEQTLHEFSERPVDADGWESLIAAAQAAAPPRGLLDVTDRGLFHPPSMKAAIDERLAVMGEPVPSDLPGYTRLICDSLGRGHGAAVDAFETMTGQVFDRILMVGGGSKNRLLCQATANASGRPVHSLNLEGTAVGNMANQLVALGAVPDLATFRENLSVGLKATVYLPLAR